MKNIGYFPKNFIESYKGADILITPDKEYYVEGSIWKAKTLSACKDWVDAVILNSVSTEFKDGKQVNKTL